MTWGCVDVRLYNVGCRCGPANHAVQLAKRKAKVWALDANESMLAYARDKAAAAGVAVTTIHGDMSDFEVQVSNFSVSNGGSSTGVMPRSCSSQGVSLSCGHACSQHGHLQHHARHLATS